MALAELGAECKAEKHAQHIEKQRECIAELKQKAKELEKVHEGHNTKKTSMLTLLF